MEKTPGEPRYRQIYRDLLWEIRRGDWTEGQQMPTEEELCQRFGVSRITVRRALQMLETDGLLERTPRRGTFVRRRTMHLPSHSLYSFTELLGEDSTAVHSLLLRFERILCPESAAKKLQLSENEPVFRLERLWVQDGEPFAYGGSVLPCAVFPDLTAEEIRRRGVYGAMRALGKTPPDRATETFQAVLMDRRTARHLHRETRSAALRVERLAFRGDIPVEYSSSILTGDTICYEVQL